MIAHEQHLRLGRELGSGAVASVVEVTGGERSYAGKILHPSRARDDAARERFRGEAELMQSLVDPNILSVFGLVEIEGREVLLMELAVGGALSTVLVREGPLLEPRALAIGRAIAAGLAHAHARGVVHRDLKPANVLLDAQGAPKIADFGFARALSGPSSTEARGAVVGTPEYMAPECLDPLAVDARTDLYALGCILYELVAGRPPFAGPTPFALLEQHQRAPVPELPPARVTRDYDAIVRELLAKAPADRPQSARAVVARLDGLLGAGPRIAPRSLAEGGPTCARCGAALIPEVDACFGCGLRPFVLDPGRWSVVVIGPGELGDRLDARLRTRLLAWVRAHRSSGTDPTRLERETPRVPFVVASALSFEAAESLTQSIVALGLQVERREGGALAFPLMRRKMLSMGGRTGTVAGILKLATGLGGPLLAMAGAAAIVLSGAGALHASRRFVVPRGQGRRARTFSPRMAAAIERTRELVPTIEAARHREALRAVVHRALRLGQVFDDPASTDAELGRAIDAALLVTTRLDELDRALAGVDPQLATADVRARIVERDRQQALLLDLSAALEALQARAVARIAPTTDDEGDLRARIEALEEVSAL